VTVAVGAPVTNTPWLRPLLASLGRARPTRVLPSPRACPSLDSVLDLGGTAIDDIIVLLFFSKIIFNIY
jgi:hypothetical protein